MIWDPSLLDANEGIRFRGLSIPEVQQQLPSFNLNAGDGDPIPEGLLWLLMTGEIPTKDETKGLMNELRERSELPEKVVNLIANFPHSSMHPMTQLSSAILGFIILF